MTERVVVGLEAVQIEQHEHGRPPRIGQLVEVGHQLAPVAEAGEAVRLGRQFELALGLAHLDAHVLVQTPCGERRDTCRRHVCGVDGSPLPRVRPRFGPVEHRVRFQRSEHAVVN